MPLSKSHIVWPLVLTALFLVCAVVAPRFWRLGVNLEPPDTMSLMENRNQLDQTVWHAERQAQQYERALVQLWDRLRVSNDKWGVLSEFAFDNLKIGKLENKTEDLGHDIIFSRLLPATESLTRGQFSTELNRLREQGFRIVQSEWHHRRFYPPTEAAAPRSDVEFELHITATSSTDSMARRYIARGIVEIIWAPLTNSNQVPVARTVTSRDVEVLRRVGEPVFQYETTFSRQGETYSSALPVIVYDLNGDGDAEIILSRWNRVYWNDMPGRFREAKFLDRFSPHWETAIVAHFNADSNADFLTVGKGNRPVVYFGDQLGRFPHEGQPCSDAQVEEPSAITAGDIDADGDLDVWISQYKLAYRRGQMPTPYYDANDGFPAYLLLNDGQGRFTDVTEQAGLANKRFRRTYSNSFIDLDEDDDLDLIVVSDFAGVDIYLNDGLGHFQEATDRLIDDRHLFGMAHTFGDYNGDGLLDLYVIGMSSTTARRLDFLGLGRLDRPDIHRMRAAMTYGNRLLVAKGSRFVAPHFADQVARTGWSWGTSTFDFDNDGDQDIYVGNGFISGRSSQDYCTRYWCHDVYAGSSQPDPVMEELFAKTLRQVDQGEISWNGYEHNVLMMNQNGRKFTNIAFLLGVAFEFDTRSVITEDLDGDGRVDLLVGQYTHDGRGFALDVHVYMNKLATRNNWIGVRLQEKGNGQSPVGAKITIKSPVGKSIARIVTGDSFMAQHANSAHFGLGLAKEVESIEIRWPNGTTQRLERPNVNRYHTFGE